MWLALYTEGSATLADAVFLIVDVEVEQFVEDVEEMKTASVVFEQDFDQETLAEFSSLRLIRLSLAEKQLKNLEATLDDMQTRGLLDASKRMSAKQELKAELTQKIEVLKLRNSEAADIVYLDEVEFYLKVIAGE